MKKALLLALTIAVLTGLFCAAADAYPQFVVSELKWTKVTEPSGDIPNFTARLTVRVKNAGDQVGTLSNIGAVVNVYNVDKYGRKVYVVANKPITFYAYGVQVNPGYSQGWYTDIPMPYFSTAKYQADVKFTGTTPTVSAIQ